jgi:glycosyltransferase involved in cell wall biosynthesis
MNESNIEVSVVIPTAFDNIEYLQQALASIERCTAMTYEIIVVLNGDQPKSRKICEAYSVRIVELEENYGFGVAMNAGFEEAKGECIVAMNDDVILTKDWDIYLREVLETFHTKNPLPRAGLVGPCTNFAGGVQNVPIPGLTLENLEETAVKFREENKENWIPSIFVSGFCFMFSREFYNDMLDKYGHFFDADTFPIGGAEDNDLCVRAIYNGWSPVVVGTCYVYHFGQRTTSKFKEEIAGGVKNLYHLYEKWKPKEEQILGALYRVKLTRPEHVEDWVRSFRNAYTFADRIYILDDQSNKELWPEEELKEIEDKIVWLERRKKKQLESDDRQDLYARAREDGCDWVISIDHDEVFEDKFDYDYAHRLMRNPRPSVLAYIFHWYHLWNDENHWRADGNRGKFLGARMVRCLPKFYIPKRAFHVGNIPQLPKHSMDMTTVRIRHYGQMREDERERKMEYYEESDPVKDPKLIGNEDYSHLVDESNAILMPWQEDCSISLITIMKNEEVGLHHYLSQYWSFFDEIVLVDTGSTDRSIELAEMFGAKVIKHKWTENFSDARNKALRAARCDWITHIDIDEDIPEIQKVRRMVESSSADGYMFYVNNILPNGKSAMSETVRIMRNHGKWYYTGYVHETVDESIKQNKLKVFRSTTGITHRGFLKAPDQMKAKLANYLRMNLRQIQDFPNDGRGYYNAALHFAEAGFREVAVFLLERAVQLNPKFLQAVNELAMFHADESYKLFKYLLSLIPDDHALTPMFRDSLERLSGVREERTAIDKTHVAEVLQEEEFHEIGKQLAKLAEGRTK